MAWLGYSKVPASAALASPPGPPLLGRVKPFPQEGVGHEEGVGHGVEASAACAVVL